MSGKITEIKFSKEDLAVFDKLSKINDKLFISADKIQVIDGQLKSDGSANNRFSGGNKTAMYRFPTPFSFIDDLGICDFPKFINIIKNLKDDAVIEVYEKYLKIKDSVVSCIFHLTPPDKNIIPMVKAEELIEKAKATTKGRVVFNMTNEQLQKLFDMQRLIGTFTTHFYFDEVEDLNIKISESFQDNGSNTATIKISKEQIEIDTLDDIKGGKYNKFDFFRTDFVVNDNYKFLLTKTAMLVCGENCRTDYVVKATFVNLED